ncbi:hypothetical protein [Deinococcus phoenicis]|uniref:hypothetical protein n=1 Tax=Deinococcus phoenicis TaxID=1476583 RepID=UPI0012695C5A|nr:hypothetical protein [Deinococcus phoenicis]
MRFNKSSVISFARNATEAALALIAIFAFIKLGKRLTYIALMAISQAALISCVSMASCMFSFYRTLDDQPDTRKAARAAGRHFISAGLLSFAALMYSGGYYIFSSTPDEVGSPVRGIMAVFFGVTSVYILMGFYDLISALMALSFKEREV